MIIYFHQVSGRVPASDVKRETLVGSGAGCLKDRQRRRVVTTRPDGPARTVGLQASMARSRLPGRELREPADLPGRPLARRTLGRSARTVERERPACPDGRSLRRNRSARTVRGTHRRPTCPDGRRRFTPLEPQRSPACVPRRLVHGALRPHRSWSRYPHPPRRRRGASDSRSRRRRIP